MRIDYKVAIREDAEALAALERRFRGKRIAVRVQALRLLKSGQERSLRAVGPVVGYTERQLQKWWRLYRAGGLEALLEVKPHKGSVSRLSDEAYAGLAKEMAEGKVGTLKDARVYLDREWGIVYRSLNGVWRQLNRRGAKPKTGRRRPPQADNDQQEAFKQLLSSLPSSSVSAGGEEAGNHDPGHCILAIAHSY